RWLATILARGRAADPAARFASMAELIAALGKDPARTWRRLLVGGALAALIVAGFLAGRARPVEVCAGADAELATVWRPEERAAALARIGGLGGYGAQLAPALSAAPAEPAAAGSAARREGCQLHLRGVTSDALLDRRGACLERGRAALAAVRESVVRAGADGLPGVAQAVRALPDPAACADAEALLAEV